MTRKDAVIALLDMKDGMPLDKCADWMEACDMAIKALRAWDKVLEESDNGIVIKAEIDPERKLYGEHGCMQCWLCQNHISSFAYGKVLLPECKVADKYMTHIYETPCSHFSLIPEFEKMQKLNAPTEIQAQWIHDGRYLICSHCHTSFHDDIMEYFYQETPPFCPECGAKMCL